MNRIPYIAGTIALIAVFGCAPKNDESKPAEASKEAAASAKPAQPASDESLSLKYMDAATALSIDDFDAARTALAALAKESNGDLQKTAQAAADAKDIAAMRESFKELSALASAMKLPADYAVAYCPMFKGGSKWVQKKDKLANPYFGKSMQTCGSWAKT